jgi:hypothetical protein
MVVSQAESSARCATSVARNMHRQAGTSQRTPRCYNLNAFQEPNARVDDLPGCHPQPSRGVAQPGRAPGSGPGGRRFKSSLPDQSFQIHAAIRRRLHRFPPIRLRSGQALAKSARMGQSLRNGASRKSKVGQQGCLISL